MIELLKKYYIYLFCVIIGCVFMYGIGLIKKDIAVLQKDGVVVKGTYFEKVRRLRKGDIYKYEFYVNGNRFTGSYSTRRTIKMTDSVEIIYYKNDPNINQVATAYVKNESASR